MQRNNTFLRKHVSMKLLEVSLFFASVVSPVLSDTDIYFLVCLIYLLFFICLLGDSKKHSKCKRNFEDIFNRTKDISKSLR